MKKTASGKVVAALLFVWGSSISGCARKNMVAAQTEGYLVLGPRAAAEFHMVPADTVKEIPATSVTPALRLAAESTAVRYKSSEKCTRFFRRDQKYVVLLSASCEKGTITDDGEQLAAFNADGRQIGFTLSSLTPRDYSDLTPSKRP